MNAIPSGIIVAENWFPDIINMLIGYCYNYKNL